MNTVSLIGMPGAGKSTIGIILAKLIQVDFVDTDLLIQLRHGKSLQAILDQEGYLTLRRYEEAVILEAPLSNTLVATGGSAVYSEKVMRRLKDAGPVVFIHVELPELLARVRDEQTRGIARPPESTLREVYEERLPLYRLFADFTLVPEQQSNADTSAGNIARWLARNDR